MVDILGLCLLFLTGSESVSNRVRLSTLSIVCPIQGPKIEGDVLLKAGILCSLCPKHGKFFSYPQRYPYVQKLVKYPPTHTHTHTHTLLPLEKLAECMISLRSSRFLSESASGRTKMK